MPKKSRRSHIPGTARKRKVRRQGQGPAIAPEPEVEQLEDDSEDAPIFGEPPAANFPLDSGGVVETRPHWRDARQNRSRLETVRAASREGTTSMRVTPGQLPVFARSYLISELRRITITASALLALILVLAVLLR